MPKGDLLLVLLLLALGAQPGKDVRAELATLQAAADKVVYMRKCNSLRWTLGSDESLLAPRGLGKPSQARGDQIAYLGVV